MAQKHLIVIHGRSIKPAKTPMRALSKDAILEGLRRAGADDIAARFDRGGQDNIRFSFAYYGDINNRLHEEHRHKEAKLLRDTCPETGKAAFPIENLRRDFEYTKEISKFTKSAYQRVIDQSEGWQFWDEAADFFSFAGTLLSASALNIAFIKYPKPDLRQYLESHETGSQIRLRLGEILEPALERGDDICILAHSMGTMVTYDELWKYAMRSEYRDLRALNNKVSLFLTTGCPLGEPGVRLNLLDAKWPRREQYPRDITRWQNLYAVDDYISHVEKLRLAFGEMRRDGHVDDIRDRKLYNCWTYADLDTGKRVSNPHDFYGFLMHHETGTEIANWAGGQ